MLLTVSVRCESFRLPVEKRRKPLFDIRAAVAVPSAHIREVRVLRESHGHAMRIVTAEIFGEIGAHLFDGRRIRIRGVRLVLRGSRRKAALEGPAKLRAPR